MYTSLKPLHNRISFLAGQRNKGGPVDLKVGVASIADPERDGKSQIARLAGPARGKSPIMRSDQADPTTNFDGSRFT